MVLRMRNVKNIMDNMMRKNNANLVMGSKFLRMAQNMKVFGKEIRPMVTGDSLFQLIKSLMFMRDNGKTTKPTDTEFTTIVMELLTKVNG